MTNTLRVPVILIQTHQVGSINPLLTGKCNNLDLFSICQIQNNFGPYKNKTDELTDSSRVVGGNSDRTNT